MPVEVKQFFGNMDTDSPPEAIGKGFHKEAWDIIFRGPAGNMRPETNVGTTLVPNALLPAGTNMTIHAHYDAVNQRIFFFNYNSTGSNGIFIYYTLLKTFSLLIQDGVNTQGIVLGFLPTARITSVDILYADDNTGDLLYFIDSLGRPTKLNIPRYLAGTYNPIKRSFIDVAKAPPVMVPKVVYENDTTVQANNMINALFQFAYTYIYDDFEESVVGSASRVPLPTLPFDPTLNIDKSQNARIGLYVSTGDVDVKKIRIYARQTKDGTKSDWLIIDTLIKSDLGIPDNTAYKYLFYNDGNYTAADPAFTVLLFDFVPQKANTQALLNGDTLSFAGVTEGYDYPASHISSSVISAAPLYYPINGMLFFAHQNGDGSVTIFLTGAGTNNGSGEPVDLLNAATGFFVRAKVGAVDKSFNITGNSNMNIATILFNLRGAATSAGWTFISSTTNSITVSLANSVLQSSYSFGAIAPTNQYNTFLYAHYPEANYAYGKVYFDEKGRTNGVVTNVGANITTPLYGAATIAQVTLNVGGDVPPAWAKYWNVVRTDNLTYAKHEYWVSESAYTNNSQLGGTQYAYIGISNIFDYNVNLGAAEGVVSYSFSQGDRIRIMGRFDASGTFFNSSYDYAIVNVVVNPVVNGINKVGTFVQINYPSADIGPNLKFDGTPDYQNYQILLYSYQSRLATAQNTFFEVGERYGIGNLGTNTAYHMGNQADNIVVLNEGDIFYRTRKVPTGITYLIDCGSFPQGTTYSTLQVNVPLPVTTGLYSIIGGNHLNASLDPTQYPHTPDTDYTIQNTSAIPISVRLRGTIPVLAPDDTNGTFGLYVKLADSSGAGQAIQIIPNQNNILQNTQYNFTFDATILLQPGTKLWLIGYAVNRMDITGFQLRLDVVRSQSIQIFEPSFSDIYNIQTNADNRPDVVDATALQTYYDTRFRFSLPNQSDTLINNNNRFYPNNLDEWDKSFGDVMRLRVRERELRVFQKRRCGHVGIYAKFIADNAGNNTLVTTDAIITPNNIEYFAGEFGIGNQPDSLCSSGYADYFCDPVKGYFLRLSLDGIIAISEKYKLQTFAGNNLPKYLNDYAYQFGGNAVVLGAYNFCKDKDSEALFSMQGGVLGSDTIIGRTVAFAEERNAWSSYYKFVPDAMVCAENLMILFYNGNLYTLDNNTDFATYFGTAYEPSITPVFNDQIAIKKTYQAMAMQGNQYWESPTNGDILTSEINDQTGLPQISQLLARDYHIREGLRYAAFLRDANSGLNPKVALVNGDFLKGNYIIVKLTYRGNKFGFIFMPYVKWTVSSRNF